MIKYYYLLKEKKVEKRSHPPAGKWCEADSDYPHAEVYEIFEDEDGTCTALVSERKLANFLDEQKRREYELRKQS